MPIVVRELVIRARVEDANASNNCGGTNTTGSGKRSTPASAGAAAGSSATLSVEKVMEALELKRER